MSEWAHASSLAARARTIAARCRMIRSRKRKRGARSSRPQLSLPEAEAPAARQRRKRRQCATYVGGVERSWGEGIGLTGMPPVRRKSVNKILATLKRFAKRSRVIGYWLLVIGGTALSRPRSQIAFGNGRLASEAKRRLRVRVREYNLGEAKVDRAPPNNQ